MRGPGDLAGEDHGERADRERRRDGRIRHLPDAGHRDAAGRLGGVAKFGDDLTVTVVAQNEDGAVLKFTAP